ncbi:glycosyltransferase involved in cell wall biosynthesis [Palleronia aestuarii]|uniref:Glycosyltransferase involved in cell wall biosynthesis n=1 Tax=Palleronia aestuarii TaxID=568105 RepID=A0A2W7NHB9_9RHOB|nr:glycosyltransferase [Palleronia aestuarii]PZX18853.1 glycosyltransferase involved in cell wall biosynthesis [Palleronia aestuarii]
MQFLFLHQNFPGQFAHLAPALAAAGHRVVALTSRVAEAQVWRGVEVLPYRYAVPQDTRLHPWMTTLNRAVDRGAATYRAALALRERGFAPDCILAHSGWGEALFLREVWPRARMGVFSEFYYAAEGADVDFDPEFQRAGEIGRVHRMRFKNMAIRMQLEEADQGITPTRWQADAHPPDLRGKLTVIHDGIDTDAIAPDPAASLELAGLDPLDRSDEVITFVNRNLEPYRGFHVFMRALPALLARRPLARVIVVGEDGVSYGTAPEGGGTWREVMTREVRGRIPDADWARVHFAGRIGRDDFTRLLQVSRVHLYLTYPFVLSWSLLEAMSVGVAIVASDTGPVREAITDGETGRLVDFFDAGALVEAVSKLLDDGAARARLGAAARARIVRDYDLARVCLPRQMAWIEALARG